DDYVAMLLKEMRMVMAEHPEEKFRRFMSVVARPAR
ncbi:coproporphyrinogen III oxidase, partial [Lacticaseibacillus paracasei subsp. paracasei Lpp48]